MKKRMLAGILVIAIFGTVLAGCGKKSEKAQESGDTTVESLEKNEPENETQPEDEKEAEVSTEKGGDWFEEKGLTITPQGDFPLSYPVYERSEADYSVDMDNILGTENVMGNVVITEKVEDGYKKVEFLVSYDRSPLVDKYIDFSSGFIPFEGLELFCFDRYTGTFFVLADNLFEVENGKEELGENEVRARNYVAVYDEDTNEFISNMQGITIICPPDYDGAILGIANVSSENWELCRSLHASDIASAGGTTIGTGADVSQILQSDCLFFSLTDK